MDAVTLGRRIAAIRQAKGLSQMDVMRRGGWSIGHIGKIERGVVDPRLSTLARLAEDLDVELSVFFS